MNLPISWFKKLFSPDTEASMKRFICFVLVAVHIISYFLLMYLPIEIKNRELVLNAQDINKWLILVFGGYIAAEPLLAKLKLGGPSNVVIQDVQKQDINTNGANIQKINQPLKE